MLTTVKQRVCNNFIVVSTVKIRIDRHKNVIQHHDNIIMAREMKCMRLVVKSRFPS